MPNTFLFNLIVILVVGIPFYFQREIQAVPRNPDSVSEINRLNTKLTLFLVFCLFILSFLFQQSNGTLAYGACLLSYFMLSTFRSKALNEIEPVKNSPVKDFKKSLRTLLALGTIYGGYLFVVYVLIPVLGIPIAVSLSLFCIVYLAPLSVRVGLPVSRMHDSAIRESLLEIFRKSGNPIGEIYLIDSTQEKSYNAFVCGPRFGFGPFRRSLFVTGNLFEILEPEEIKAVICHEAAHFNLNHFFKRTLICIGGMLAGIAASFFPIFLISITFNLPILRSTSLLVFCTVVTLFVQFAILFRSIRRQEFEADAEAVRLGARRTALASALEKLSEHNGAQTVEKASFSSRIWGGSHPTLHERLQALGTFTNRTAPAAPHTNPLNYAQ